MIKLINKEVFGIIVLLIALVPQIQHSVHVYNSTGHQQGTLVAWCYALSVDLAILIFTVRGWINTAIAFLVATLAHNLAYQFLPKNSPLSSVLIGVTLSATIFSFSHVFYDKKKKRKESAEDNAHLDLSKRIGSALTNGVRIEALPYVCPECGESFPTAKKLNGHISGHKSKGDWKEDTYGDWKQKNKERCSLLHELDLEELGSGIPTDN